MHGCKLVDANAYANNTRMRLAGNEIGTFHAAPAETEWDADDVRVYTDTRSRKGMPFKRGMVGYHRKITYAKAHVYPAVHAARNPKQSNKRKKRKEDMRNAGRRQVLFFIPTTNLAIHIGDIPRLILTRTYEKPFAPPAENVELQLPSTEAVIRWYRHTLDAPRGQMPRGFLVSSAMSGLCQIEQRPIVCKVMIKMECLAQPQGKVFVVSLGGPLRTGPALLVGAPPVAGL
ncbi:hypothetical protein ALC57_10327 [Trachymyrmex cornetzi]|uniref:Uncharacterized protein n=1 Tax=Trachymyrmex cornetzi TaxID=471704 RepID=A0A195DWY8_9HYME|nr:hypothetical protein ALC57_10327 [Trachymyrmex cornetzi]